MADDSLLVKNPVDGDLRTDRGARLVSVGPGQPVRGGTTPRDGFFTSLLVASPTGKSPLNVPRDASRPFPGHGGLHGSEPAYRNSPSL